MGDLTADTNIGKHDGELDGLYRAHRVRAVAVAAHLLGDRTAAEDVVQEAFIQLAARQDEVEDPGAWVRTVTYRRALNELRRRERERAAVSRHTRLTEWGYPNDVVDPMDARLAAALGQLSANQRAAVLLCWVDELSVHEAAQTIGCATATVRVHLHRARKALSRILREEQP